MSLNQFDFINVVRRKYAAKGNNSSSYTSRFSGVLEGVERYRKSVADSAAKKEKDEAAKRKEAEKARSAQEKANSMGTMQDNFNKFVGKFVTNNPAANPAPNIPTYNPAKSETPTKMAAIMDPLMVKHAAMCSGWDKLNKKLASLLKKAETDTPDTPPTPNPNTPADPKEKYKDKDWLKGMSGKPSELHEKVKKDYGLEGEAAAEKTLELINEGNTNVTQGPRSWVREYAPMVLGQMGLLRDDYYARSKTPIVDLHNNTAPDNRLMDYQSAMMQHNMIRNSGMYGGAGYGWPSGLPMSQQQQLPRGPGAWGGY